jgi:transcriptional regulator with XRE-family HTH domain
MELGGAIQVGPGERLKELREHLGITTREVKEYSRRIATAQANPEFYISNAWLTQVETTDSVPSIYKLYSLSVIYRIKFVELLLLFGIDLERISSYQLAMPLPKTHLTNLEVYDRDRTVTFPVRFDPGFTPDKTTLISRIVELWGEIPTSLIQHLDIQHHQYGFVGLQDYTLHPLVPPGSLVQIDDRMNRVTTSTWTTEFDRPIYFVELRDGYACSWCELKENQLNLVPHPLSPCRIRTFAYLTEAEIVGRVTAIAMRIVPRRGHLADGTGALPERS